MATTHDGSRGLGHRGALRIAVRVATAVAWAALAAPGTPVRAEEAGPQAGDDSTPDTWYVATVTSSDTGALITHYWSKSRLFRAESVLSGHRIVTIVNGDYYYALDPVLGDGLKIARDEKALADDARGGRPFAREWEQFEAGGAERVREETLGGHRVAMYQLTDQGGRRRIWVTQEAPRLPFRMELFDRRRSATNIVDYTGWAHGLDIAESFFRPDSNIELTELSYEEYRERAMQGPALPIPVLYRELLHGVRER